MSKPFWVDSLVTMARTGISLTWSRPSIFWSFFLFVDLPLRVEEVKFFDISLSVAGFQTE